VQSRSVSFTSHLEFHMMPIRVVVVALFVVSAAALAQEQGPGQGKGGPGGHHGPPPQEALKACEGKSVDAACSFTHDGHDVTGSCFTPASDKPLVCRPSGPPPKGG
jgi:hypothetical protein